MNKFKVGDKAVKHRGYKFPCTIVSVFETVKGAVRLVGEMDEYGLLHIFNEDQLYHVADETVELKKGDRFTTYRDDLEREIVRVKIVRGLPRYMLDKPFIDPDDGYESWSFQKGSIFYDETTRLIKNVPI